MHQKIPLRRQQYRFTVRVGIYGLAHVHGLEGQGSLFVVKDEEQPKLLPVDAFGRGDDRWQEGVAQAGSRFTLPAFIK